MKSLRYTLLPDGTSDRAFIPILTWLLRQNGVKIPIEHDWAKLGSLSNPPKKLAERITKSLEIAPCDLLFVHRDAEKENREVRVAEIKRALKESNCPYFSR
jgi:hypothetical protein